LSGIDGLWIEEGEDISESTLRVLTASVRLNAKDTERLIAGEDVKMPEIIITMNRGSRSGAIAQKWLLRAEKELNRCGYYEDDLIMVVEMNYTDMPIDWFTASGLEQERVDDYEKLSRAEYDHKWLGKFYDEVEGSIIKPEWFDACIDAHKRPELKARFKPHGAIRCSHDPADQGKDSKGFASMQGSVITHVKEYDRGEVDEAIDWAIDNAIELRADQFIWDGDGMGTGAKGQVRGRLDPKKIDYHMFRGSLAGQAQDNAKLIYQEDKSKPDKNPLTYADAFKNNRAQYYFRLATRMYNTFKCVEKGEYIDPDEMISFDSDGIDSLAGLKSELSRIPKKPNGTGLKQIMSKEDMKKLGIPSPNMADSIMMLMTDFDAEEPELEPINFNSPW